MSWIIERGGEKRIRYYATMDNTPLVERDFLAARGDFIWTTQANDAIRFERHEDAQNFLNGIQSCLDGVNIREALVGLRRGDPRPLIIEMELMQ